MSLNTVTTGNTILAADINQLVNVLQRPSGQTEAGHYFLAGGVYTNNATQSCYVISLSRTSSPVSVSFDTADLAPTGGMGTVATGQLTSGGFQIYSITSTAGTNPRAGGAYTIQY